MLTSVMRTSRSKDAQRINLQRIGNGFVQWPNYCICIPKQVKSETCRTYGLFRWVYCTSVHPCSLKVITRLLQIQQHQAKSFQCYALLNPTIFYLFIFFTKIDTYRKHGRVMKKQGKMILKKNRNHINIKRPSLTAFAIWGRSHRSKHAINPRKHSTVWTYSLDTNTHVCRVYVCYKCM